MSRPDHLILSWGPGEIRAASVDGDERLLDLALLRPDDCQGAIFLGRVVEINKALGACFVEIGQDRPGFLPGLDHAVGEAIIVRVAAAPRHGKGAKLATRRNGAGLATLFPPPYAAKPPACLQAADPVARFIAAFPDLRIVVDDVRLLNHPQAEITRDSLAPLFDEALAEALAPEIALPGGGRLTIETTRALTAIDIDSGGAKPADVNACAMAEIARQIRLRNLCGQVVIDPVSERRRDSGRRLSGLLRDHVADDPVPTHILGATALGLIEMTRERRLPPLDELTFEPPERLRCARSVALEAFRAALAEAVHSPRLATLVAAPEIIAQAQALTGARAETEQRLGRILTLRPDPSLARHAFYFEPS